MDPDSETERSSEDPMRFGRYCVFIFGTLCLQASPTETTLVPPRAVVESDGNSHLRDWLCFVALSPQKETASTSVLVPDDADVAATQNLTRSVWAREDLRGVHSPTPILKEGVWVNPASIPGVAGHGLGQERALYAACILVAKHATVGYLTFSANGALSVYLNGKRCHRGFVTSNLRQYDVSMPVNLAEGENLLIVRLAERGQPWMFRCTYSSSIGTAADLTLQDCTQFARPMWVGSGSEFCTAITMPGAPQGVRYSGVLTNLMTGESVSLLCLSEGSTVTIPADGVFRLELSSRDRIVRRQTILRGSPEGLLQMVTEGVPIGPEAELQLALHQRWLAYHLKPQNRRVDSAEWRARFAWGLEQAAINHSTGRYGGPRGLQLRAFRSPIDGSVQCYRAFIPACADKKRLPLFVVMSPIVKKKQPFLESPFMMAHGEAESIARAAEILGVAVVWPGFRSAPTGMPLDFVHVDSVIKDFSERTSIDQQAISLIGVCAGARFAAQMAEIWPGRFAFIGTYNPEFRAPQSIWNMDEGSGNAHALRAWEEHCDVFSRIESLDVQAVIIWHDGNPVHGGDVEGTEILRLRASHALVQLEFSNIAMPPHESSVISDLLAVIARRTVRERTWNRLGQFPQATSAVFDGPTILATCHLADDDGGSESVANEIAECWRRECGGELPRRSGVRLPDILNTDSNVILVGASATELCQTLVGRDMVGKEAVSMDGEKWVGENLAVQMVLTHPAYPKRRIVLVTAWDLRHAKFGSLNVALEGWYNRAVWSNVADVPFLIAARFGRSVKVGD